MKATGLVRKTDKLGCLVIPKELRNVLEIAENTPIEIFVEDDSIILKKYDTSSSIKKHMVGIEKGIKEIQHQIGKENTDKILGYIHEAKILLSCQSPMTKATGL